MSRSDTFQSFPIPIKMQLHYSFILHYNTIMVGTDDDIDLGIDLELYRCKFYGTNNELQHTYFLVVPTDKNNASIDINYIPNVQPIDDAVKRWTQQPWFHRSEIEKFRLIYPKGTIPASGIYPFRRLWTEMARRR